MKSESYQNIGKNIRQRMTDLNLTQQDLADKLHVSRQTVGSWVRTSDPVIPKSDDLPAIASVLRTTVGWLYSGVTVPNWIVKEKMFDEEHMYTRLKAYAISEHLNQFGRALSYAKKPSYNAVKNILAAQESSGNPQASKKAHGLTRGADYFRRRS